MIVFLDSNPGDDGEIFSKLTGTKETKHNSSLPLW